MTWPVTIHADNNGAIALSTNDKNHRCTKHINVRHHFVKERAEANEVNFKYIPSALNMADFLTKPLPRDTIWKIIAALDLGLQPLNTAVQGECWRELQYPDFMPTSFFLHSWCLIISHTPPLSLFLISLL